MPGFGLTALVTLGSEREVYVAAGRAFPVVSSMIFLTWTLSTIVSSSERTLTVPVVEDVRRDVGAWDAPLVLSSHVR